MGLLDDRKEPVELARGKGCRACYQSGYAGRDVIAELLLLTPAIRDLILRRAPERDLVAAAQQDGMKTLRDHGLAKAAKRLTTLDEVFRTTIGQVVEG